jgi:hypothetical protein
MDAGAEQREAHNKVDSTLGECINDQQRVINSFQQMAARLSDEEVSCHVVNC